MDTTEVLDLLEDLVEELEVTAESHRQRMRDTDDPFEAAEHRGISRGLLFVASKIRVALLNNG